MFDFYSVAFAACALLQYEVPEPKIDMQATPASAAASGRHE